MRCVIQVSHSLFQSSISPPFLVLIHLSGFCRIVSFMPFRYRHQPDMVPTTSPLVGRKVRKLFNDGWFDGRILCEIEDRRGVFSVVYGDGDDEEMLEADARSAARKYKTWNPEDIPTLKSLCGNDDAAVEVLVNLRLGDFWKDVYQKVRVYARNSDLWDHSAWGPVVKRKTWASFKKVSSKSPTATLRDRMLKQWKEDRVALRPKKNEARAAEGQNGWEQYDKDRSLTRVLCDICAYPPGLFEGRCSCGSVAHWVAPETHLSNAELLTKNQGLLVAQCSYAGPVVPRHHTETSATLFNIAMCQMNIFSCGTYPDTTRCLPGAGWTTQRPSLNLVLLVLITIAWAGSRPCSQLSEVAR